MVFQRENPFCGAPLFIHFYRTRGFLRAVLLRLAKEPGLR